MHHIKQLLLLSSLFITSYCLADKIEKKGTILNSNCNPIGTNCKATSNVSVTYSYVFNEPHIGGFGLQISTQELNKIPALQKLLVNKTHFKLEEAFQIPIDITQAFHIASDYKVAPGIYPIRFQNNYYIILFKD